MTHPTGATKDAIIDIRIDPITRYIHITYLVPSSAGDEIEVICSWTAPGTSAWKPAKVTPFVSETAINLVSEKIWNQWMLEGKIIERLATSLTRTLVFNPYPEAQRDGLVDIDFRISIQTPQGTPIAEYVQRFEIDVLAAKDWSTIIQKDAISEVEGKEDWRIHADVAPDGHLEKSLSGESQSGLPLPQITLPLDLCGHYAIFVRTTPNKGGVQLRLSSDERFDKLASPRMFEEVFWRWCRMDRQDLVIKQPYDYSGPTSAQIDYVRFVPLSEEALKSLEAPFDSAPDKIVVGYFEPYSWAFHEDIQNTLQHREPLTAYKEAEVPIIDVQVGRFGAKVGYKSQIADRLIYETIGDPIGNVAKPKTNNVGKMHQYTNALETELRYAEEMGLQMRVNFGASNCYPNTPLQADFSKQHPEWMRSSQLRFEVPQVREYALSIYQELLEIGARRLSIDFCRYPETIDCVETCNLFLRQLRLLVDAYAHKNKLERITILVRFPGKGVRLWEFFDYQTWAHEGLVDFLCPSGIQGRHLHIDMTPYLKAVDGTRCKLLPVVDGLGWGLTMPGPFLQRVAQLYEQGVPGIYVYQSDAKVLGRPGDRRCMRLLTKSAAVFQWRDAQEELQNSLSKGIYLSRPIRGAYNKYERLRVWTEGIAQGELDFELDGKFLWHCDGPPYMLGDEEYESDGVIPSGKHELRVRARDGNDWLEEVFDIERA